MALSDMVIFPPKGLLALLLVLLMAAGGQMASEKEAPPPPPSPPPRPRVCLEHKNSVDLEPPETLLVHTEDLTLRVVMRECGFGPLEATNVDLRGTPARNLTSALGSSPWYEVHFDDEGDQAVLRIGSRVISRLDKVLCHTVQVYFPRTCILGRICQHERNRTSSYPFFGGQDAVRRNDSLVNVFDLFAKYLRNPDFAQDPLDDPQFAGYPPDPVQTPEPPLGDSYDSPYRRNNREESVIPIFIGVLAFVVSMCVRFCLCRRKRVVTTVAVIRSLPSQDLESSGDSPGLRREHLDLPPAYADILDEMGCPQGSYEDLPPAYDDIDPTPPPYSDIEVQPPSGGPDAETTTTPADAGSVQADPPATEERPSPLSRVLSSQFRSLRTQFAFKHLQEES